MNKRLILIEAIYSLLVLFQILFYPALVGIAIVRYFQKWFKPNRSPHSLFGEVALITGSGRGLGRDIAITLAKHGCHIAIVDIQDNLAKETAKYITEKYGVKTKAYTVDVQDYQQLLNLQKNVTSDLGDVTILVNNAGILTLSSIENPPADEVQRMINVNLTAPVLTTQIFLPKIKELNRGYIINISSISAMYPSPFYNVYAATKSALCHLTSSLRIDLLQSKSNVKAITVCPSFLTTNKRVLELLKVLKIVNILANLNGQDVAECILEAMLRGDDELTLPRPFLLFSRLMAPLPVYVVEKLTATFTKNLNTFINCNELSQILKADDVPMHVESNK
ncbi:protein dhs-3-like [Musca autumnalis]|uniref:protein dhs-3-like n=1 Tax=Musca autumnalis TaxID=221902 RepID=UPI003CEB1089